MADIKYEMVGRFIYSSLRLGDGLPCLGKWFATDLGVPPPVAADDEHAVFALYEAWYLKHDAANDCMQNYEAFIASLDAQRG